MTTADSPVSPGAMSAETLGDIRVVDVANFLAGPMVSMYLADFGAEVVKVEQPTGDELRSWGREKHGVGLFHKMINRGKRSVTADLRTEIGVDIVCRLVRQADVLVENFRPGTLERWGLGPERLHDENPRLVIVRISGFGQTGPYASRPGFGTLAEAFSGYAHITGTADGPPLLPAFGLADATTALGAAFLTMVALHERDRSGSGQVIDLAIYEELLTLLGPQVIDHDQLGIVQNREGSRLPFTAPRNTYRTADGRWVAISGSAQSTFVRICKALDLGHLVDDPRFGDNRARIRHADLLDHALQSAIAGFELDELMRRFEEHEAPVAAVHDVEQVCADPQVRARENVVAVFDEELDDDIRMQNVVGKLSRTPGSIRWPGPRVGQHNREVLVDELGFTPDELREGGLAL